MKNEQPKYSKTEFDGFTHRFIVVINIDEDWRNNINLTIYSNSPSYESLSLFLQEHKQSFEIVYRATKEQDEAASIFIEEFLKELN